VRFAFVIFWPMLSSGAVSTGQPVPAWKL
jgi:hypothetical protein